MNNDANNGSAFRSLRIIYFAMLGGTVLFALIVYFILPGGGNAFRGNEKNILVIALFVAAFALALSAYLWRKDIAALQERSGSLREKFESYRAAAIRRYAFAEFAALFCIICYFLTWEVRLYIAVAILIVHFLTLFPSSAKIAAQLGENAEDIERI